MKNYLDCKNKINEENLRKMAEKLRDGEIVVFPTETVYAIGVNGFDKIAINKLYEVKDRPKDKAISLLVSDLEMVEKLAKNISELEYKIMKKFFPGPLTIILNKKDIVPDELTVGKNTVGIRMPENKIALKLIEYAGVPIAAPSANITGNPSGIDIEQIKKEFGNKVENYIDGGKSKIGIPSTIVQVIDGKINILREGTISKEELERIK